jgi:polyhydroxyalkanoate synthesis regulator phasin
MEQITMQQRFDARREQMLRELASDLSDLVASGDMTDQQANEWFNDKADQWSKE